MTRFLTKYPTLAGLFLLVIGVLFMKDTFSDAARYHEYDRGPRVMASVTKVVPVAEEGKFQLELFWRDPDGESHRKSTTTANDEGFEVRDRVPIALHVSDYSRFLYGETLEERQAGVIEVFGLRAVNTVFIGLILAVAGLLILFLLPHLDLEPAAAADPVPSTVHRSPMASTNIRLVTARRVAAVTILVWGVLSLLFSFTPAFQFSSGQDQAYLLGYLAGRLAFVGLLVAAWGLVTANEWSWGGAAARLVVVLVILGVLGGGDTARKMLDRPESAKTEDGPFLVNRP